MQLGPTPHLECSVAEGVARVVPNRPERLNALSPEMVEGMNELFPRLELDSTVGRGSTFRIRMPRMA